MFLKRKQSHNNKESKTNIPRYERINFFKDFKNNGYVKKVLCLYEDTHINSDVVYYNDREKTDIPCIDNDVLIISNYDHENKIDTYTLVQVNFSVPNKYEIIMTKSVSYDDVCHSNAKYEIYKYIRENELVEIKEKPEDKSPQIDFGYGKIVIEILEGLMNLNIEKQEYTKSELFDLILNNVELSKEFMNASSSIDNRRTMEIRVRNRLDYYLDIIFQVSEKDKISINDAVFNGRKCQENYYYNI